MDSRKPFIVYQRKSGAKEGQTWYVAFWSPEEQKYRGRRSLHTVDEAEANQRAEAINRARPSAENPPIAVYLKDFWGPDSEYVRAKARRRKGRKRHAPGYLKLNSSYVRLYVEDFEPFTTTRVSDATPELFEKWMDWMEKKGKSGRVMNIALQAARVGIRRWHKQKKLADPLEGFEKAAEDTVPRGSLSLAEIKALLALRECVNPRWKTKTEMQEIDPRVRAAVKMSMLSSLRIGECRGIRWEHVHEDQGMIDVQEQVASNETDRRPPKSGSFGEVPVPEEVFEVLRELAERSPWGRTGYVLYTEDPEKPIGYDLLANGFVRMLRAIGITEERRRARNLSYHSTRHAYVSLARLAGLPLFAVQQWARQKTPIVTEGYSHSNIVDMEEARRKLGNAVKQKKGKRAAG